MTAVDPNAKTATLSAPSGEKSTTALPGLLVVFEGEIGFQYRAISVKEKVEIGRATECALSLADSSASRCHAMVTRLSAELSVQDQSSRNGTWLNGNQIGHQATPLNIGDLIRVGSSLIIVVDSADGHQPLDTPLVGGKWTRSIGEFVKRFGSTPMSVLLLGETGTGKEVVAHALHHASGRPGPLISVNCAALPENLAESQLFGHRRGAFSGATEQQDGFFVAAHQGTLFLDEVGELSSAVQVKLLRTLETGEVIPVGATHPTKVNVRILSATSRDLPHACQQNQFRLDLFHRLNAVSLWLAPLHERIEEVSLFTRHFLNEIPPAMTISSSCLETLILHSWPGNVRELKHAIQAAVISARSRGSDQVENQDLNSKSNEGHPPSSEATSPAVAEVVEAMRRFEGNVSRAAQALGIHRAQLYRVLQKNRLSSDDFRRS